MSIIIDKNGEPHSIKDIRSLFGKIEIEKIVYIDFQCYSFLEEKFCILLKFIHFWI